MSRLKRMAISDDGFIFDPASGESFTVNETARDILKCLIENMSHDEIAKNLSEEYDAPVEDIHRDINEFIQQLNNLHVIGQ